MNIDKITEPQEWIDGLLKVYAPNSEDIDVALQNMGLRIGEMDTMLKIFKAAIETGVYPEKGSPCHDRLNKILTDG